MAAICLLSDGDVIPSAAPSPEPSTLARTTQFIATATNQYKEEGIVDIRVQDRVFRVSRNRLALRSPFFRKMFMLPQGTDIKDPEPVPIELHNDLTEFEDFLWYLHADPLSVYEFSDAEPSEKKCSTLLGIASVAHMYEALDVARWAMMRVLHILMPTSPVHPVSITASLAKQLLGTAARFQESDDTSLVSGARDVVCDALYREGPLFADPILAVRIAEEVGDTYVLAHAYFYTLQKGESYLDDARLSALDRRRLVCGAFSIGTGRLEEKRGYTHHHVGGTESPWDMGPVGQYYREWVVRVHHTIAHARGELWGMFDCARWRLID